MKGLRGAPSLIPTLQGIAAAVVGPGGGIGSVVVVAWAPSFACMAVAVDAESPASSARG